MMMMMMHHRSSIKNNGLSVLRLLGGGGVCSPSAAMPMPMPMGSSSTSSRRLLFLQAGGEGRGAFLVKRDMFRSGGKLYSERLGGGFLPHQCNIRSHMLLLPSFARRALASTSTSLSSSQEPPTTTTKQEEEEKEEECQTISSSSKLRRATDVDDEISNSTNVSLNQFPGLLAPLWLPGSVSMDLSELSRICSTRNLLRLNPVTGYFEEQHDVAASTLPVPNGHICRGSAYGWLFLTDHDLGMRLFNPFSGAEIQLPSVRKLPRSTFHVEGRRWPLNQGVVHKAVFSANPSFEPRPVVLVIYGGQPTTRLAFCKPGDKTWTPLEFSPSHTHWDAIYHKGQFYVLSYPGYVAALDIGRLIDDDDHSVKTTLVATPPKRGKTKVRLSYLVVVDGELVKVELRRKCLQGCCIEQRLKEIEIERKRDGDTSDEEEDYSSGERKRDGDTSDEEEDYSSGERKSDGDTSDEEEDYSSGERKSDGDTSEEEEDYSSGERKSDGDTSDEEEDYSSSDDEEAGIEFERNGGSTIDDGKMHYFGGKDDGEPQWIFPHRILCPSTYGVKIRRLDVKNEKQWVKVESLGGKAVFVGYNTSFALSASDYPAGVCIPDSIYFTYGYGGTSQRLTYDMGIYNLKDESTKPLVPPKPISGVFSPAPIWIVNAVI